MILLAVFSITVAAVLVYRRGSGERIVVIEGKDGFWVYPLDAVQTVSVSGPLGQTVIRLEGGAACIVSSPCKNQSCVAMGHARGRGQWLACLPNRALLTIEGGAGEAGLSAAGRGEGRPRARGDAVDAATW